jgi:glutathione reductase (NADPH)
MLGADAHQSPRLRFVTAESVDFFVIGGGSGGVRAARVAATLGARVVLAEDKDLGGTCVNVGCIPKKLFVYASHVPHQLELARSFGWDAPEPRLDWARLRDAKDVEIKRLNGVYARILETAGVTVVRGRARVTSPTTVTVGDRVFEARHILVATGGRPIVRKFPGAEHAMTSDDVFHLPELPRRVFVVGGGYIAAEFACIFHGFGLEATLSYRGPLFLRGFDREAREHVAAEMRRRGISLWFDNQITGLRKRSDGALDIETSDGRAVTVDAVLCATGREPNVEGLGLAEAGVELSDAGAVIVDGHYATRVPSIHAVGDVIDRVNLTPVALAQGAYVAKRLFGEGTSEVDLELVPTAIFTQPSLATVGLSEEDARAKHRDVDVYASTFRPLAHTLGGSDERYMVKLVVDRATDRVLGVHVVGGEAGEIVQAAAVALRAGATKAVFDATIGIHPTFAEELVTLRTPRAP